MIHPAVWLHLWICALLILQALPRLFMLSCALALCVLAAWVCGQRLLRLMRRVRWMMLTLFVLFAFFTPGERVWGGIWPSLAPTHEGLWLASEHAGNLLMAVAMVALLLHAMSTLALVKALHAWLRPLSILSGGRFAAETAAVRLMLVLRHLEDAPKKSWRQWLLDEDESEEMSGIIMLHQERLNPASLCVLILSSVCWIGFAWHIARGLA